MRLMLIIIPIAKDIESSEEPPRDISGRVCPVSGNRFTCTSIWSRAWHVINMPSPAASSVGNGVVHRLQISIERKVIHKYNNISTIAATTPYSDEKKAKA